MIVSGGGQAQWLETGGTDQIIATTAGTTGPVSPGNSSSALIRKSYNYLMDHFTDHQPLVVLPNGTRLKGHTIVTGDPYKVTNMCRPPTSFQTELCRRISH